MFGACLSICLQSVLLAYTETGQIKPTQILSISFSLIIITKTTAGVLSFKKPSLTDLIEESTSTLRHIEKKLEKKTSKVHYGLQTMRKSMTEFQRRVNPSENSIGQPTESLL